MLCLVGLWLSQKFHISPNLSKLFKYIPLNLRFTSQNIYIFKRKQKKKTIINFILAPSFLTSQFNSYLYNNYLLKYNYLLISFALFELIDLVNQNISKYMLVSHVLFANSYITTIYICNKFISFAILHHLQMDEFFFLKIKNQNKKFQMLEIKSLSTNSSRQFWIIHQNQID